MNAKQQEWTKEYAEIKAQYDNCQTIQEVAQLTRKTRKAADADFSLICDGAINFFSGARREELSQSVIKSGNGRDRMILTITDSNGKSKGRRMS